MTWRLAKRTASAALTASKRASSAWSRFDSALLVMVMFLLAGQGDGQEHERDDERQPLQSGPVITPSQGSCPPAREQPDQGGHGGVARLGLGLGAPLLRRGAEQLADGGDVVVGGHPLGPGGLVEDEVVSRDAGPQDDALERRHGLVVEAEHGQSAMLGRASLRHGHSSRLSRSRK